MANQYPEGPTPEEQPPGPMKPHRGQTILVLGIVGIIFAVICSIVGIALGIIAWVMATGDLREMNQGTMDPAGRGLTNAGRICGMVAVILGIISALVGIYRLITFAPRALRDLSRTR